MAEFVFVYDTGGGIRNVPIVTGVLRVSGSAYSHLEEHLDEHSAIVGGTPAFSSNEFIRVRDDGGGIRNVPVAAGVAFVLSNSNLATFDGHSLQHTAMNAGSAFTIPATNEYVQVHNTGGGIRLVPVLDGCLGIEGTRSTTSFSEHQAIHAVIGGPVGGVFQGISNSGLYIPLLNTLVPSRGTSAPTFVRATSAWVFDNEGKLRTVPSGCVRMQGARLVRNLLSASEDLNSASWTKTNLTVTSGQADPDGGTSAWKVEAASSAAITFYQASPSGTNAKTYVYNFFVKKGSGALDANKFYLYDTTATVNVLGVSINYDTGVVTYLVGSTGVTVTSAPNGFWRVEMRADAVTQGNQLRCYTFFTGSVETGGEFAYFYHPQLEDVSGQADQTASEYVSVGVLSAPWHGAGVDGCKWFPTNKDGSAISASTLEGYLAEPSRTNNCLWGRDFRSELWYTNSTGSDIVVNGDFGVATGWTTEAGWSIGAGVLTGTATSANTYRAATITAGEYYDISFEITARTAGLVSVSIGGTTITKWFSAVGTARLKMLAGSNGTIAVKSSGFSGSIDNLSVRLSSSAFNFATTTGLDNVADSASRLTAAANDATIMQLLTAATGTRTASDYIKRISGTGTVSITRNGGTDWTDVTSQLVSGTWIPVALTSDVGANPTVGIKMGTSGDVIDVDCVQDENGAWRTSPILTTTAAVTRNADVLSYASALDVAQGTALCSLRSDNSVVNSVTYALTGDSNGRILYWNNISKTTGSSYDGTNIALATGGNINTGIRKRATRWGTDLRMAGEGALGAATAFDGSLGAIATLTVGSDSSGTNQISGPIREVHIWPTPLTDAQMQQVTS